MPARPVAPLARVAVQGLACLTAGTVSVLAVPAAHAAPTTPTKPTARKVASAETQRHTARRTIVRARVATATREVVDASRSQVRPAVTTVPAAPSTPSAPVATAPTSTPVTGTSTGTATTPASTGVAAATTPYSADAAIALAQQYSGIWYVWGGATPAGFDCSGYVQYIHKQLGISLPRTAEAQRKAVTAVTEPQVGDLVFFGVPAYHVGIYAGDGKMYDSPRSGKQTGLHPIYSKTVTYGRPGATS